MSDKLISDIVRRCVDAFYWHGPKYAAEVLDHCADSCALTPQHQWAIAHGYEDAINRKH